MKAVGLTISEDQINVVFMNGLTHRDQTHGDILECGTSLTREMIDIAPRCEATQYERGAAYSRAFAAPTRRQGRGSRSRATCASLNHVQVLHGAPPSSRCTRPLSGSVGTAEDGFSNEDCFCKAGYGCGKNGRDESGSDTTIERRMKWVRRGTQWRKPFQERSESQGEELEH